MIGLNRHTGRAVAGDAHLSQSIVDILTTPKGTRVMRRAYGSDLPNIIDQPLNGETLVDAYMAVAEALDAWEPRIDLAQIALTDAAPGRAVFDLMGAQGDVIAIEAAA